MDKKLTLVIVAIAIIIVLVSGALFLNNNNTANEITDKNTLTETPGNSFKDGTYTAQGDYMIHLGPKHISVTITLDGGIITDAKVVNQADDPTSKKYQDQFIAGFADQVMGKNISDVNVTKVSGSSLTPQGFNDALTKIEQEARM